MVSPAGGGGVASRGGGGSNRSLNQGFARAVGLATSILLAPFSILNVVSDHVQNSWVCDSSI